MDGQGPDGFPTDRAGLRDQRLSRRTALLRAGRGGVVASGLAALALGAAAPAGVDAQPPPCSGAQPSNDPASPYGCGAMDLVVPPATHASLPPTAPAHAGRLRQLTDYDRGLWLDTGAAWVSVRGQIFDVRAFGAVGDGASDDWPAFNAAIEAMSSWLGDPSSSSEGSTLLVPPGTYRLAQSLVITRAIRLTGVGAGGRLAAAVLHFDAGLAGVVIAAAQPGVSGRRAEGATVERLRIETTPGPAPVADGEVTVAPHGVWMRTRASIIDCAVRGFAGDGIRVDELADDVTTGWLVDGGEVTGCGGHGLGASQASGGLCARLRVEGNGKWGIADDSRLGNTYLQCRAQTNRGGAFSATGAANHSLFLNVASSADQPASGFAPATMVVGGDHGAGFVGGNAWTAAGARMVLQAQSPGSGSSASASAPTLAVHGAAGQTQSHLRVEDAGGARLAELDVAGRLFLGPLGAPPTSNASLGPRLVNLSGTPSEPAGIRWDVAGTTGGFVGQIQGFLELAGPNAPGVGASLRFQVAGPQGQAIDTLALQAGRVGIGTPAPAGNAILELASTTQSFLPPRMTTAQRDAIPGPTEGALVYNLTTHRLNLHDGSAWREIGLATVGG